MDKKRGYNIKYLLLFTSAAALLCALAAYISINDTYKYTRERAAFLAESYGSQTRYELMDLYDDPAGYAGCQRYKNSRTRKRFSQYVRAWYPENEQCLYSL